MEWRNEEFDLGGVNHLALVCSDMKRTVEFYTQVLGMRLIKTLNLPGNSGQHFFFDMGGGNALAFFWFPDAPDPVPGVSAPVTVPGIGEWTSAVGSMNHVAFNVPEEKFLEYRAKLKAKGVRVSPVLDHDDSEFGVARELHPGVFVRSFYFQDPDGILLDDRWGETVHAVVVAAPGFDAPEFDAAGLVSWARGQLAGFKCPTGVTVVPELPRNATGKVLRAALREPFWAGRERLAS